MRELLQGFELFFGAAVEEWNADGRPQRFGNLIATRLPVAQVQHHPLPYPADGGVRSMARMCTVVTLRDAQLGPVRVMTTHLEFYSRRQRMAQAAALRELHRQACEQAAAPPEPSDDGSPFQTKVHTANAILCGDFNLKAQEPEYTKIQSPFVVGAGHEVPAPLRRRQRLWDSWRLLHGKTPQPPTFCVFDHSYMPEPIACDFVFVSESLKDRVRSVRVDSQTQASDHQPVALELT